MNTLENAEAALACVAANGSGENCEVLSDDAVAIIAELARLRVIEASLPLSADGVRCGLGDTIFFDEYGDGSYIREEKVIGIRQKDDSTEYEPIYRWSWGEAMVPWQPFYSTNAALLAAKGST